MPLWIPPPQSVNPAPASSGHQYHPGRNVTQEAKHERRELQQVRKKTTTEPDLNRTNAIGSTPTGQGNSVGLNIPR